MGDFEYLSVLFSVILGLALTQILQAVPKLLIARARVRIYWPAVIWAVLVVLIVVQDWWTTIGLRSLAHWNFAIYAIIILFMIVLYIIAGLALPCTEDAGVIDMKKEYFAHSRWFFGLFALMVLLSLAKDLVVAGRISSNENLLFHGIFLVSAAVAALTRSRWYHALLAPAFAALFVAYIVLLFARL